MGNELKIATYNIHDGRNYEKIAGNLLELGEQGVNLFCLQEVRPLFRGVKIKGILNERLAPNIKKEYFQGMGGHYLDFGLGMMWDESILDNTAFSRLELPELPASKSWERIFFQLHGLKINKIRRGALIGTFNINGVTIRVANTHLDFQGGLGQRSKQITYIKNCLDSLNPVDCEIICGDFNTLGIFNRAATMAAVQSLLPGFKNVFNKPYVTLRPYQQLDYMFVKGAGIQHAEVARIKGSDHFPIIATLKI
jgi:endonuclease/exonuclease/phosphatase family metal-dependent hydrolase